MKNVFFILSSIIFFISCDNSTSSHEKKNNVFGIISYSYDNGTVSPPYYVKNSFTFDQNGILNHKKTGVKDTVLEEHDIDIDQKFIDTLITLVIDSNICSLDSMYYKDDGLVGGSNRKLNIIMDSVNKSINIYRLYEDGMPPSLFLLEKSILEKIKEVDSDHS